MIGVLQQWKPEIHPKDSTVPVCHRFNRLKRKTTGGGN
jgi:hypothetical protein